MAGAGARSDGSPPGALSAVQALAAEEEAARARQAREVEVGDWG